MQFVFALLIIGGLIWIFIKGSTAPNKTEFQRMADEYSNEGFFVDSEGCNQSDADILIDMYLTLNPQPRTVIEKDRCEV
jgi:hypothetical protein